MIVLSVNGDKYTDDQKELWHSDINCFLQGYYGE